MNEETPGQPDTHELSLDQIHLLGDLLSCLDAAGYAPEDTQELQLILTAHLRSQAGSPLPRRDEGDQALRSEPDDALLDSLDTAALIARSSLGTPSARRIRSLTSTAQIAEILRRRDQIITAEQQPLAGMAGTRVAGDKPWAGERGTRRASRNNRRLGIRRAVPTLRRFAIMLAAAAAAFVATWAFHGLPWSVPIVPIPAISPAALITSVSDALLFASDSADLTPSADALLRPLVQSALNQHLAVSITGYASPGGGSDAYDLALSARRAAAVRDRLIALGLPSVQITHVTGDGARSQSLNACRLDKTRCADLRRVVIVLSPKAP
jgi:outer membrane protein OmpA-like peptidoglycan-associated protein